MSDDGFAARSRTLVAVAAAMVLLLALPIALGTVYVRDDLSYYSIPLRSFLADCLASGRDASWCPAIFGGYSFYGEGGGFAHPVIRALYAYLPFGLAFNLDVIWPYPAMLVGFALLLRRWGLRRDAALFGGLIYAFGGQNLLQYVHTAVSSLLGHLPWMLIVIDVAVRSEDRRRAAAARVGLAILTASQVLIGHVQYLWISLLGEALYALFLVGRRPGAWRPLAGLATAVGCGILAGSIQLLPTWEAFRESRRERPSLTYVAQGSLPPANLMQSFAPYLTRSRVVTPPMATDDGVLAPAPSMLDWRVHEFATYLGAAIPALLAWLFIARRELGAKARPLALFGLGLGAITLILAFGDFTPLFHLTVKIPVVGRFRIPARHLVLYQAAVAILAALAFATLAARSAPGGRVAWRRLWPLAVPPAVSLAWTLAPSLPEGWWPAYLRGDLIAAAPWLVAGPALVGVATVLVALAARGWRGSLPLLAVFTAADLAAYAIHTELHNPPTTLAAFHAARPTPPAVQDGTRVAHDLIHFTSHNPYLMQGLGTMQGYVSLAPRRVLGYDTPNARRVAGVGWISRGHLPDAANWERAPVPPLPRARLVARVQPSTDPKRDLETIDPATTVLADRAIPLREAEPGRARITAEQPGRIDVRTDAATRQVLVVAESFHDGWTVRIDGQPARLERAYGDFLACVIPRGTHRIKLRFESPGRRAGAWLSLAGLILSVAVPVVPLLHGRTRREPRSILRGPTHAPARQGIASAIGRGPHRMAGRWSRTRAADPQGEADAARRTGIDES